MAGSAAHVIVGGDLSAAQLELAADDAHHLASVLRLRPGEPVGATDGRGGFVECRYAGPGRLEVTGPVSVVPPPAPALTVAFAPVKGDRPEWAVQKLAELGVDRIVLLEAERSVVRWAGTRADSHRDRLEKVVRAAVMQSRQVWVPVVEGPVPAVAFMRSCPSAGAAVAQMGGPAPSASLHTVLVGPEGGWSPAELAAAPATVGLGPSVLRAETAAVAAGVILSALRAGVVGPAVGASGAPGSPGAAGAAGAPGGAG